MPKEATQFRKGQSGNPKGRPQSLSRRIRGLEASDGRPLDAYIAEEMLAIAQNLKAPLRERREALNWLAERGWGKAPAYAPVEEGDPLGLDNTDREVKRLQDELAARRKTKVAGAEKAGTVDRGSTNGAASTTG